MLAVEVGRTMTLHLTGPALRISEASSSLQPARQVNAVVRPQKKGGGHAVTWCVTEAILRFVRAASGSQGGVSLSHRWHRFRRRRYDDYTLAGVLRSASEG